MISIITCSGRENDWKIHKAQITSMAGCENEYIRIDNSDNRYGICAAYNLGIEKASGDILVFMHEDVFLITQGWGNLLEQKFRGDSSIGLIGVAGTQYLFKDNPSWVAAGRPFILGRVIHEIKNENRCLLTIYSQSEKDSEAVAADGLFLAIRKSLFDTIRFDENAFDKFHFYDLDICMQVRKTHKVIITSDILVKHLSGGSFDDNWKEQGKKFLEKYRDELPASCTDKVPDTSNRIPFDSFPVDKILSSRTVAIIKSIGMKPNEIQIPSSAENIRNNDIIAVTGMHRSGTSCIAGLLNKCGYSLGARENLLNKNNPKFDNQKGHFENINAVMINDTILKLAGGTWCQLPSQESVNNTDEAVKNHIIRFSQTFDGFIIKDPRLCLTLGLWKKYCPGLKSVAICFRHPLSVALSLQKRNNFPIEVGLNLWHEYNIRLIDNIEHIPVAVIDYDNLKEHLEDDLFDLLRTTQSTITREKMKENISGFYESDMNHNSFSEKDTETLPENIKELYRILKSQSIAVLMGRG